MYICDTCGALCDEPATYREYHGFAFGGYEELMLDCDCGGEWEEAVECDCCGLPFRKSELNLCDEGRLCDDCYVDEDEGEEIDEVLTLADVRALLLKAMGHSSRTITT